MQHTSLCSTLQPCFGHSWESIQILCNQSFKAPRSAIRFPHIPQYSDIERLRVLSVLQLQPVTRLQIRSLNPFDKAQSQAVAFRQIPTVLIRFTFTEISTIIPVFAASISIGDVWTCRKTKRSEEEEGGSQWDESWQIWGLLQLGRSYFAEASNRYTFQQLCGKFLVLPKLDFKTNFSTIEKILRFTVAGKPDPPRRVPEFSRTYVYFSLHVDEA